jgi:hypothetical protein
MNLQPKRRHEDREKYCKRWEEEEAVAILPGEWRRRASFEGQKALRVSLPNE